MNLSNPITTVDAMADFIWDFKLLLEIELTITEQNPHEKTAAAIQTFTKLHEELNVIFLPKSTSTTAGGFFLPADMEFPAEATEILSQMQKTIKDAEFKGLNVFALIKNKGVMEGYQSPPGCHRHKCPKCNTIWEHSDSPWQFWKTHNCPNCGTKQLYRYFGPEQPHLWA